MKERRAKVKTLGRRQDTIGSQGHDHLRVPSWAGSELDESPRDGGRLIKKVNSGLLKEGTDEPRLHSR